jgi:hypothetical protein
VLLRGETLPMCLEPDVLWGMSELVDLNFVRLGSRWRGKKVGQDISTLLPLAGLFATESLNRN